MIPTKKFASGPISRLLTWGGILLILFLFFGCLILAFLLKGQINQSDFLKVSYQANQAQYDSLHTQLHQVKDSLNREHTKTVVLEADNKGFRALIQAQDQFMIRNLKDLNIKINDLKSITSLKVETSGQFTTLIKDSVITTFLLKDSIRIDTIRTVIKTIDFADSLGWFTMKGLIKNDSIRFNPVFKNDFTIAAYREHRPRKYIIDPKFLRGKHTVVEVISKNPYSSVKELKHVIQN